MLLLVKPCLGTRTCRPRDNGEVALPRQSLQTRRGGTTQYGLCGGVRVGVGRGGDVPPDPRTGETRGGQGVREQTAPEI